MHVIGISAQRFNASMTTTFMSKAIEGSQRDNENLSVIWGRCHCACSDRITFFYAAFRMAVVPMKMVLSEAQ